jgi:hypothetical protein
MVATAGLSLTLDPMGKMFQNASSLKPLGQLKPNCPGMIIGQFVFHADRKSIVKNWQIVKKMKLKNLKMN